MVRQSGDAIAMSPPLVIEKTQIDEIIDITAGRSRRSPNKRCWGGPGYSGRVTLNDGLLL